MGQGPRRSVPLIDPSSLGASGRPELVKAIGASGARNLASRCLGRLVVQAASGRSMISGFWLPVNRSGERGCALQRLERGVLPVLQRWRARPPLLWPAQGRPARHTDLWPSSHGPASRVVLRDHAAHRDAGRARSRPSIEPTPDVDQSRCHETESRHSSAGTGRWQPGARERLALAAGTGHREGLRPGEGGRDRRQGRHHPKHVRPSRR